MEREQSMPTNDAISEALMMTIQDVANALQCSDRHVTDLRKENRIPQPVILGKRKGVRWPRHVIEEWIASGCPALAV
jgi:predicted DNA-binding transcriptional regulator AlpA